MITSVKKLPATKTQNRQHKPANAPTKAAELSIYEEIGGNWLGEGLTAKSFKDELDALGAVDEIVLRINSPGGIISDGLAIYNLLVAHPAAKTVHIDGIALSTASFIAMAASPGRLHMAENSLMMIHNAWGGTVGDYREHQKQVDVLKKHDTLIARTYAARAGQPDQTFLELMAEETWLTAEEAVAQGLADEITPAQTVENKFDMKIMARFRKTPDALKQRIAAGAKPAPASPVTEPEIAANQADGDSAAEARAVEIRLRLLELENEAA
jgi:ATP-dependent Clp protease protease subunit